MLSYTANARAAVERVEEDGVGVDHQDAVEKYTVHSSSARIFNL